MYVSVEQPKTMTPEQAIDAAVSLRARQIVPIHYGAGSKPSYLEAADSIARRHRHFDLTLGSVGAFPNFRRARVVWMGVESEPKLEWLHHDLEVACADVY